MGQKKYKKSQLKNFCELKIKDINSISLGVQRCRKSVFEKTNFCLKIEFEMKILCFRLRLFRVLVSGLAQLKKGAEVSI